jgi:hypothetical protein
MMVAYFKRLKVQLLVLLKYKFSCTDLNLLVLNNNKSSVGLLDRQTDGAIYTQCYVAC